MRSNKIKLLQGGKEFFGLLESLICNSRHFIYIQMYIFDDDQTGTCIAHALKTAAERGVQVFVLADGYASQGMSRAFIRNMKSSGIHFRFFEPLLRSSHFYFGRRMHQKVIVVDGVSALVGGINIADRYNEVDGIMPWLDFALYLEGEAAIQLSRICMQYWKDESVSGQLPERPKFTDLLADEPFSSVRVRQNDWVKGKHEVWRTYFNLFNHAEKSITIICSYFLPGRVLRKRLGMAAKRGVKVKVILAGPSDVMLAKNAERYLYDWMFRYGIEIYEYQPTVLHAKMAVVDNRWVTIGSFNVNNISAYASSELNLDIRNRQFAHMVQEKLDDIMVRDCIRITEKNSATNATLLKRFLQKSSYEVIRVILNLSTFYFKQE